MPPASYGQKLERAAGDERYRRALYTFRYRSVPYPMLQNFDAPNGDASCVRRALNTPLQALTTLNEPLFIETARLWRCARCGKAARRDARRATALSAAAWPANRPRRNRRSCSDCFTSRHSVSPTKNKARGRWLRTRTISRRHCPRARHRPSLPPGLRSPACC